jgi:hypothetical protein
MDEGIERDNTSGGGGLHCPVSTSVQFSLRDEGSTEYMCVRGKITGDNIYRCQSACPESIATISPFSPIEGQKWFDHISSQ